MRLSNLQIPKKFETRIGPSYYTIILGHEKTTYVNRYNEKEQFTKRPIFTEAFANCFGPVSPMHTHDTKRRVMGIHFDMSFLLPSLNLNDNMYLPGACGHISRVLGCIAVGSCKRLCKPDRCLIMPTVSSPLRQDGLLRMIEI